MAVRIYYFSGTGNSLFAAKELAKRLPGADFGQTDDACRTKLTMYLGPN